MFASDGQKGDPSPPAVLCERSPLFGSVTKRPSIQSVAASSVVPSRFSCLQPDAWHYRVSAGTGRPGVSIL